MAIINDLVNVLIPCLRLLLLKEGSGLLQLSDHHGTAALHKITP